MPFDISNQPDLLILKLAGSITIRQAHELAAQMAEALETHTPVVVDTQNLEDIDTCMLQLLCSVQKTALALSFDNSSEAFVNAIERCGLRRELIGAKEGL